MKTIDIIKPNIYDSFQCKGTACRKTCCAGWKITVSKSEYQDLKNKLKHVGTTILERFPQQDRSTTIYGQFVLEAEKGCPLQSGEGLCGLQISYGPEALPNVCAFFPRQGIRCGDEMHLSLTPACEKVLELLLEEDRPLEFVRQKDPLPPMPVLYLSGDKARKIWNYYVQLQEFCILLLQAREVSMDHKMVILGMGLKQIDTYYQNGELHKISGYIDRYLTMLGDSDDVTEGLHSEGVAPAILLGSFISSGTNAAAYIELTKKVMGNLKAKVQQKEGIKKADLTFSNGEYAKRRKLFSRFTERHPYFLENLMVLLFTGKRWGAIPDINHTIWEQYMYACWVYSNLKFVLTACLEEDTRDEELLDICIVLFRSWIHNEETKKNVVQHFHETGSDTPAHMAMLVQAG